ncbi:MAG: S41 family peptidase [Candidatus Harrisonbacteria bacterium]|nr:S41 family peptidase [Candidatus Harrisonbacteria bacterium]
MRRLVCAILILFVFTNNGFSNDPEAPLYPEQNQQKSAPTSLNELFRNTQSKAGAKITFFEILNLIETEYYKELDMEKCVEQILARGVSYCTDQYSFYLNEKANDQEKDSFKGKFGGIGVVLSAKEENKLIEVTGVVKNTPAEKAGLRPGDFILAIATSTNNSNWTSLEGLPVQAAVELIRGEIGTPIKLKILRNNKEKDLSLIRAIIKIERVESKKINGVGYIKLIEFSGEDFLQDFYLTLQNFEREKVKVLIIDVRNNPGGLLHYVIAAACVFSDSCNEVVYEKRRKGDFEKSGAQLMIQGALNAMTGKFKNFKLIVLQNGHSASASEILSAYLQSEVGATVIGLPSYGKGVVQSLMPLQNGGVLHLTVSEYFVGSKKVKIHGIGVKPDIKVKNPARIKTEAEDLQLQKALRVANQLLLQK